MLLSVDWDAFSGTRELVFDAPIWGTPDRDADRLDVWRQRALRRGAVPQLPSQWEVLANDFPLYPGWEGLRRYAGVPTWATLSHADAWHWLDHFQPQEVLNIDSHHDMSSFSGDRNRLRAGNWAGLALAAGKISAYTCQYPAWHRDMAVAEGFDLERTQEELTPLLAPEVLDRVNLTRADPTEQPWPQPEVVEGLLLVQSPSWTSPAHDAVFEELLMFFQARSLTPPLRRH